MTSAVAIINVRSQKVNLQTIFVNHQIKEKTQPRFVEAQAEERNQDKKNCKELLSLLKNAINEHRITDSEFKCSVLLLKFPIIDRLVVLTQD